MTFARQPEQTQKPGRRLVGALLVAILLVALLLRVGVALYLGNEADPVSGAADQYSYDVLATRVLDGHGFSFPRDWYPFTRANEPTAHWSYLYTLYLAAVYFVGGHQPLYARLVQCVLSLLMCVFAYRIGRTLFGQWAGLGAALLVACYAYLIFFAAALMTQTFYITALMAALDRALALAQQPNRRDWLLLGIALGFGVVLRQTLLLFVPFLLIWLAALTRASWKQVLAPLVMVALFIIPWTVYNYLVFNDFLLLNANGGFWMYSSNHPGQGTSFDPNFVAPLPPDLVGLPEPEIDRQLYRLGLQNILADPERFVQLSINRLKDYFWLAPSDRSSTLSNLGRVFSYTLYLPFMVYGLYLSRRQWRLVLPLYLYVAIDTLLHLTTWAAPRYRLPSDVVMIVFAGLAVATVLAPGHGLHRAIKRAQGALIST